VPQVLRMLLDHELAERRLRHDHRTHDGEELEGVPSRATRGPGRHPPWSKPMYPQGHLAILRGNPAPEGCVAKITGLKNPSITGPARVFDSEAPACRRSWRARSRPAT
jgi:dihydroxy-acid dehydratase